MSVVEKVITQFLADRNLPQIQPEDDTNILEIGFDSIGLATLLADLEDETGMDPFKNGFINFRTVGELKDLYKQ